jgi:hypothetical protein
MRRTWSPAIALLLLASAAPAWAQSSFDSLTCFKPKDQTARGKFTLVNGSQACTFRTPARFACVASSGGTVTPTPPEGTVGSVETNLLCYRAKCVGTASGTAPVFRDAVARREVRLKAGKLVCLPANMPTGTTTTTLVGTPGTTTTTTIASGACGFEDGQCSGTCPAGQTCGAAVGTASCECRETSCGDADAPTCNGACDDPEQACVFLLAGCECVDIP